MLLNCYLNTYLHCKEYLPKIGYIFLLSICFSSISLATTQNYRLVLTETPTTSLLLGWELIGGCPDLQRVYYDTVDHGRDTAAYAFQSTITAANFHMGMENYFCHLKGLQPATRYYIVIGEDKGISPRLIAQTFSLTTDRWQSGWVSLQIANDWEAWPQIVQQIKENALDFVMMDHLSLLTTEDDWRNWLEHWQPSTYNYRLVPIVATGLLTPDIQYLLNISGGKLRQYAIADQSILLVTESKEVKKRFWRSLPDSSLVIWHNPLISKDLSEKVDLVLTGATRQENQLPNIFHFPDGQNMVVLEKMNEKLQIRSSDKTTLYEIFFN
ncbi:MAG: fibronectin type III domain-containing protein [Bacteroidota bacterium]